MKSLDAFDFPAIPSVNRQLVTQLARCEYIESRERHSHRQQRNRQDAHRPTRTRRLPEGTDGCFTTASALVNELMEARDERGC